MTYTLDTSYVGYEPVLSGWKSTLVSRGAVGDADVIIGTYDFRCQRYNLNPNIALAQACLESAYFTSDRWKNEWNPAGLGITSGNTPSNPFGSPQEGITAHCQHICCYVYAQGNCYVERLGDVIADRRHLFHDGMPLLSDLERFHVDANGIKVSDRMWAVPNGWPNTDQDPLDYCRQIADIANSITNTVVNPGGTMNIIDLRGQLPIAANQGPQGGQDSHGAFFSPKQGIIIHYSGVDYPDTENIVDILKSEAAFHIGPYLNEYSLAYHYSVDPQTGDIYQCRDEAAILWHCASWPENETWYSVHVPFGPNGSLSDKGIAGLVSLVKFLQQRDGISHNALKGHQEVSSTACPGPLMNQFVLPWRAGSLDNVTPNPPPPPDPTQDGYTHSNGFIIGGAFQRLYTSTPYFLQAFGLALSNEKQGQVTDPAADGQDAHAVTKQRTVQDFERAIFVYQPENAPPWDVAVMPLTSSVAE